MGAQVRTARIRRRITQRQLGARVGLSQSAISRAERGLGGGLTLDAWQRIALALGLRLQIALQRDPLEETADASHLAIQELLLRTGRAGRRRHRTSRHLEAAEVPSHKPAPIPAGRIPMDDQHVAHRQLRGLRPMGDRHLINSTASTG